MKSAKEFLLVFLIIALTVALVIGLYQLLDSNTDAETLPVMGKNEYYDLLEAEVNNFSKLEWDITAFNILKDRIENETKVDKNLRKQLIQRLIREYLISMDKAAKQYCQTHTDAMGLKLLEDELKKYYKGADTIYACEGYALIRDFKNCLYYLSEITRFTTKDSFQLHIKKYYEEKLEQYRITPFLKDNIKLQKIILRKIEMLAEHEKLDKNFKNYFRIWPCEKFKSNQFYYKLCDSLSKLNSN